MDVVGRGRGCERDSVMNVFEDGGMNLVADEELICGIQKSYSIGASTQRTIH
jgi:hypothetical protein